MKSVLIVDDSRVSRKMISKLVESNGFSVAAECVNGKEGYEQYVKLSPDIVIMDITMPEMNGMDSLRLIMEHDPDAKVIILSAAGQKEKREEAEKYGASFYVTKPYQIKELVDAMNNC